jgi:hypothetical protein
MSDSHCIITAVNTWKVFSARYENGKKVQNSDPLDGQAITDSIPFSDLVAIAIDDKSDQVCLYVQIAGSQIAEYRSHDKGKTWKLTKNAIDLIDRNGVV